MKKKKKKKKKKKIKNSQPQTKCTGSYKKKSVIGMAPNSDCRDLSLDSRGEIQMKKYFNVGWQCW